MVASLTAVAEMAVADAVLTPAAEPMVDLDAAVVCYHVADAADLADAVHSRAAELMAAVTRVAAVAGFCNDVVAVDATQVAVLPTPDAEPTLIMVVVADLAAFCRGCLHHDVVRRSVAAVAVVHRSVAVLTPAADAMTAADFRDSVCLTA